MYAIHMMMMPTYLELGDYGNITTHDDFIRSGNILEYPSRKEQVGMAKELATGQV